MVEVANPALDAFVARIGQEAIFGQVLMQKQTDGWELRHVEERGISGLRPVSVEQLRGVAQFTAKGAFRPLKSAPNLQTGWRLQVRTAAELEAAMNHLYPGAIADCFAAQQTPAPVTHYREFTDRQTGMYRITQMLSDEQAEAMIRACCHAQFCLKRRFWTVGGLAPDEPTEKSAIACLEPCAILLEFARKATRIEQAEKVSLILSGDDMDTARAALKHALAHPPENLREADFGTALNPRRVQMLLEKLPKTQSDEN